MSSLLEGAKRLVSRGSDLGDRIEGLEQASEAARGRLDDHVVDEAEAAATRVATRLGLTADHTVVALAGATGSGKSSTFNALAGVELTSVGVRRPTTSWATACVWGKEGATELLEYLDIAPRHQVMRDSLLDLGKEDSALQGVVLLDLPDHDSTEVSHHLEVDRLIELADLMVWVLDPQKYADAAIHDRYLAPLSTHKDVMLVVLNHIDEVPVDRRESMIDDVRRLVDADGLIGVPVLAMSAKTGEGVDELRDEIARRVKAKKVTRARLEADVRSAATQLQEANGTSTHPELSKERIAALDDALAVAAGVPTVVEAVASATRMRANRATGWPVTAWLSRLRPDPAQAPAPRPRQGRQAVHRPRSHLRPGPDAGAARRRRQGGARRRRHGVRATDAALGGVGPPGVGLAAARPQRPARLRAGCHRAQRRADPRVGRARAGAPVAVAARRAGRGGRGSACWRSTATSASPSRPRPTWPASRCRP